MPRPFDLDIPSEAPQTEEMWQKIEQARQPEPHCLMLDLDCLDLTELPEEITTLQGLQWLTASMNQLTELPANIGKLTNLKILDLCYNEIGRASCRERVCLAV